MIILLSSFSSILISLSGFFSSALFYTITHFSLPPCFPSSHLLLSPSNTAVWTWLRWLGCAARGRSCPASTRSCSATCRTSSTRPGTWPSTATRWAARACSLQSSLCSRWWRRTSPFYMKVKQSVCGEHWISLCAFALLLHFPERPFVMLYTSFRSVWCSLLPLCCAEGHFQAQFTSAKDFPILRFVKTTEIDFSLKVLS